MIQPIMFRTLFKFDGQIRQACYVDLPLMTVVYTKCFLLYGPGKIQITSVYIDFIGFINDIISMLIKS